MSTLRYTAAWLLMPLIALRHKMLSIKGYLIEVQRGDSFEVKTIIEANNSFDAIVKNGNYGDYCRIIQINKYSPPEVIRKIQW